MVIHHGSVELTEREFEFDEVDVATLVLDPNILSSSDEEELCLDFFLIPTRLEDVPRNPALYTTQKGGQVIIECGVPVWYAEVPSCLPHAQIGDPIPARWGVIAINEAARRETPRDRGFCDFRCTTNCGRCFFG